MTRVDRAAGPAVAGVDETVREVGELDHAFGQVLLLDLDAHLVQRGLDSYCTAGRFQWQFVQPVYVGANQMQERPPAGITDSNNHTSSNTYVNAYDNTYTYVDAIPGKYIRHCCLLHQSGSWPSPKCDDDPDWHYVGLDLDRCLR